MRDGRVQFHMSQHFSGESTCGRFCIIQGTDGNPESRCIALKPAEWSVGFAKHFNTSCAQGINKCLSIGGTHAPNQDAAHNCKDGSHQKDLLRSERLSGNDQQNTRKHNTDLWRNTVIECEHLSTLLQGDNIE